MSWCRPTAYTVRPSAVLPSGVSQAGHRHDLGSFSKGWRLKGRQHGAGRERDPRDDPPSPTLTAFAASVGQASGLLRPQRFRRLNPQAAARRSVRGGTPTITMITAMAGVTIASRPASAPSSLGGAIAVAATAPRVTPAPTCSATREKIAAHVHPGRTQRRRECRSRADAAPR